MTTLVLNIFVDLIYCRTTLNKDIVSSSEKFGSPNKSFSKFSGWWFLVV